METAQERSFWDKFILYFLAIIYHPATLEYFLYISNHNNVHQ